MIDQAWCLKQVVLADSAFASERGVNLVPGQPICMLSDISPRISRCARVVRRTHWSPQTTAPVSDAGSRRFQVTHPYHPLHLQEFELVLHAQNWHEDRVWFHDANGRLRALPASWTSVVGEDPFNVVAAGRALFRVEELLELGRLIATLEP